MGQSDIQPLGTTSSVMLRSRSKQRAVFPTMSPVDEAGPEWSVRSALVQGELSSEDRVSVSGVWMTKKRRLVED